MADEVTEGAVGPSEPAPETKGANGPAGPTAPKKAKEPKLPANHTVLLSGNVLVNH